ncbi:MAG: PGPGW domain-containing protein [Planctomycetota bacterium]|nr:PGPGW domain-containing protein [Planctomycetota bacterium]
MNSADQPSPPETPQPAPTVWVQSLSRAIWLAVWLRKLVVLILGCSVVAVGVVMIVTPGPAIVVIPAGIAILATEFFWAKRLLGWVRERISRRLNSTAKTPDPP